ncbi:MAG: hypothetical protein AAF682_17750 [Planctomycetota bacterium]
MGRRQLSVALIAALALGGSAIAAQNARPADPRQISHLKAVRTERTARFFARWREASDERRVDATRVLQEMRPRGAPMGRRPALDALAAAERALGSDADPHDPLEALADSLDLQVVPGMFTAASEGRGEPLTVTVYRLFDRPAALDAELSLVWVAPDGTRTAARTEAFGADAFNRPGFLMYVRSPLGPPGTYRLLPVARAAEREAEGVAVSVPALAAGGAEEAAPSVHPRTLAALGELRSAGLRTAELTGAELARRLDAGEARPALGWCGADGLEPGPLLWGGVPAGASPAEPRRALLFLHTGAEREELPWLGPVGDAWRALALEQGLGLFSGEQRAGDPEGLGRLVAAAREEVEGGEVLLVARGSSVWVATLLLAAAPELAFDGLILVSDTAGVPRLLPDVPTLVVAPSEPERALPKQATFAAGEATAFLSEAVLPDRVGAWLAR